MNWIIELFLTLLSMPFRSDENDRSRVGKSRLDEEADRLWKWVAGIVLGVGLILWLIFRS